MRVEGVAPRTWLLATLVGWAVMVWMLALLGMGGQVRTLPGDVSLLSRLPRLAPAPAERLGPLSQYAETSARPLFSEDRRPQAFSLTAEGDATAAPAFDYVLTGVLIAPTLRMAIIEPTAGGDSLRIKLGEAAEAQPAYRLTSLAPRSAIFEGPDGPRTLELRVFDGKGGQAPTADARPGDRDAATLPADARAATQPVKPAPAIPDAPQTTDAPDTEAQIEGIRRRIEQRRAQLRQQSQNPAVPATNP